MLSRVADSLYWMSRYIERAENNARIADVNLQLLLDLANSANRICMSNGIRSSPRSRKTNSLTSLYGTARWTSRDRFRLPSKKTLTRFLPALTLARENARSTREQISSEMWEQINRLYLFVQSDTGRELAAC